MSRLRTLALRAPFLLALAPLLVVLAMQSSLLRLAFGGGAVPPYPHGALILLLALLALVPAALTRASPLAHTLAVVVPVVLFSGYGAGRLDWLRVLKDFGVAEAAPASPLRLALALLALALAWALHAADLAHRLRARALERGVPPEQARRGARASLKATARAALLAAAGTLALAMLGLLAAGWTGLVPARAAFVAPVVAAGVVALVAVLLARRREAPQ